jgi:hypothetical protein
MPGAAALCRSLRGCRDLTLRQQARDLEEVLEAPTLQRPRNWSVQVPSLGDLELVEGRSAMQSWRRRPRPEPPPPPPVGTPKTPWGFALLAVALLLLAILLAGCVQVDTSLTFPAPGRIQISQTSTSTTGQALPWQRDLAAALAGGSVQLERDPWPPNPAQPQPGRRPGPHLAGAKHRARRRPGGPQPAHARAGAGRAQLARASTATDGAGDRSQRPQGPARPGAGRPSPWRPRPWGWPAPTPCRRAPPPTNCTGALSPAP